MYEFTYYAQFLQSVIDLLLIEKNVYHMERCFICNTLENPMITDYEHRNNWRNDNAIFIERLKNAIQRKMKAYDKKKQIEYNAKNWGEITPTGTLSFVLGKEFPGADNTERRVKWLQKLIAYHTPRKTNRYS